MPAVQATHAQAGEARDRIERQVRARQGGRGRPLGDQRPAPDPIPPDGPRHGGWKIHRYILRGPTGR